MSITGAARRMAHHLDGARRRRGPQAQGGRAHQACLVSPHPNFGFVWVRRSLDLHACAACALAPPRSPLPPLAPPWPLPDPLQPLKTLTTRVQPLTTPNAPSRSIPPPYRPKALDCHALEQAIGEGKAAELPAEDLKAAEAVLEKARAAEKAKCEKDLRDKMKARSLTSPQSPHYSAPTLT